MLSYLLSLPGIWNHNLVSTTRILLSFGEKHSICQIIDIKSLEVIEFFHFFQCFINFSLYLTHFSIPAFFVLFAICKNVKWYKILLTHCHVLSPPPSLSFWPAPCDQQSASNYHPDLLPSFISFSSNPQFPSQQPPFLWWGPSSLYADKLNQSSCFQSLSKECLLCHLGS